MISPIFDFDSSCCVAAGSFFAKKIKLQVGLSQLQDIFFQAKLACRIYTFFQNHPNPLHRSKMVGPLAMMSCGSVYYAVHGGFNFSARV